MPFGATATPDDRSLQLLVESFVAIVGERQVEAVLEQAADLAAQACQADVAAAVTVAAGMVDVVVHRSLGVAVGDDGPAPLVAPELLGAVVAGRTPVRVGRRPEGGVAAFLGVPVLLGAELVGALGLGRTPGRPRFDDQDELFLEALARHTAVALNAARLAQQRERAAAVAPGRQGPVVDLTDSGVTRHGIIQAALASAREHLGMDVALVSEFAGGRQVYRIVEGEGGTFGVAVGEGVDLRDTLCARVVAGVLPEAVPDAGADPRVCGLPVTESMGIGAYLGVPVQFSDGRLFGTLCCLSHSSRPGLDERDTAFLRVVARIVAEQLETEEARTSDRRRALQRVSLVLQPGRIRPAFQPVVGLAEGEIIGVEALARFDAEPRRGPELWFAEADVVGLGQRVQTAAVRAAMDGLGVVPSSAFLSINVSPDFVVSGAAAEALEGSPLDRLVIELTEHDRVDDYAALVDALAPLRAAGVRIAVDDAGAGFASLRHILRLTPEIIKLDVSLTRGVDVDPVRAALAASLVVFAEKIGAVLVAEGVETADERDALRNLGVRYGQGFHLGPPVPTA